MTKAGSDRTTATQADGGSLSVRVVGALDEVAGAEWNRVAGSANPFVRHEFLVALERHGCVGEDSGWIPQHLLLEADSTLVGAVPMYLKYHSYGEFVFDWAWADAAERAGLRYYPKLVAAAPFTPASGPRLLCEDGAGRPALERVLAHGALEVAKRAGVSSLHWRAVRKMRWISSGL